MDKDFADWFDLKRDLHDRKDVPLFQEREIWWCAIGVNIGYEEDGKNEDYERPVLIVRKFSRQLFLGIPLTTHIRDQPFFYPFVFKGRDQCAMLLQVRAWSSRRLINKEGKLSERLFNEVREAMREML